MENQETRSSYRHILKYTGLFGGIQGLTILIGLVRNKLVAVLLGPSGVGLISLFNSTISFISSGTNLGLPTSSVKNISEAYEQQDKERLDSAICQVRTLAFLTAIFGMTVCAALGPLLNYFSFSWGDHRLHFVSLSPIIAMMAITGGETSILKGIRKLRALAAVTIYNVIGALVTSVPIYYYYRTSGVVPSLVLAAIIQMLLTIGYSYRLHPPKIKISKNTLLQSKGMVVLGVAFMISGIFTTGADFAIRSFLSSYASLDELGLYNAGFMLTTVYAGMIFTAMETDYYPRLSALNNDIEGRTLAVNHQVEVTLLLISPMLVLFTIFLPVIIPLLYTNKFLPVVGMSQITILALYLRAMKLPVAYLTLAKGDSLAFLALEAYSAAIMVLSVVCGYKWLGLDGIGWGLLATGLIDIIVINTYARIRYCYKMSVSVVKFACLQLPIGWLTFGVERCLSGAVYWTAGGLLSVLSMGISLFLLRSRTKR